MKSWLRQAWDVLNLLPDGGPGVCNIIVTSVCNAACDFCGYARSRSRGEKKRHWIDAKALRQGLDVLQARGVRYLTFTGGEPLLHPEIVSMIAYAAHDKGMRPSLVTNGWLLPRRAEALGRAGLRTVIVSVDAPTAEAHENNRGLRGVAARIRQANADLAAHGVRRLASVTINRLMGRPADMVAFLQDLGFEAVTFSYPKRAALGSTSRVFSETSELIDFAPGELEKVFDDIRALKAHFPVLNPSASLQDMARLLREEAQTFPCLAGHKYFMMDWDLNVFRCDTLPDRLGTVWEMKEQPSRRDPCTRCMSDCYRDASVPLHLPVAIGDLLQALARGQGVGAAARGLFSRRTLLAIRTLIEDRKHLSGLARTGAGRAHHQKAEPCPSKPSA